VSADDVHEITALIHEYAFRLDAGDLDGVAALFEHAELGSSVRPERMRGAREARAMYRGVVLHDDGTPRTLHQMTNVTVRVDDDRASASARTSFTVLQAAPGLGLQPIIAGRYDDRFERVDGTWRFAERIIHPTLLGDLRHHMRPGWLPEATT
jgi:hypothetical protein